MVLSLQILVISIICTILGVFMRITPTSKSFEISALATASQRRKVCRTLWFVWHFYDINPTGC